MIDTSQKAKVENNFQILSIEIPSYKNWLLLIIFSLSLLGPTFGIPKFLSNVMKHSEHFPYFIIIWFGGMLVYLFLIIRYLLWGYFGKEKFILDKNEIIYEKTVWGIGIKKKLDPKQVTNVRMEKFDLSMVGSNRTKIWSMNIGKIRFDYGKKTYCFGLGISDAEAQELANTINSRLKEF